jgi:serine/alanine adding enzyme
VYTMKDIFFLNRYIKINEIVENGISSTYEFECGYGKVSHGFVKRKIEKSVEGKVYFDIITPYGYGGPLITESSDHAKLLEMYFSSFKSFCKENNIISEFIRFHLFDNSLVRQNYYGEVINLMSNVIRDLQLPMEEIWLDFDRKVRKNYRRATKDGITLQLDQTGSELKDFLNIYYSTMERNRANNYYYFPESYFKDINLNLMGNYAYFHATMDKKIVSTELVLFSDKYAYSFMGGTLSEYYSSRPNDFLKVEIIRWCKESGKELFVLGGGYTKNDGIYQYKKAFSPNSTADYYVGKYIHNHDIYDKLVSLRAQEKKDDKNTTFFPAYRG